MEPIEGVGGKLWAKTLRYICLPRAQLSGRAFYAQTHTGDAEQVHTRAGTSSLDFGAVYGKQCALLHRYICVFQNFLPPTAPIISPRAPSEPKKVKLLNGLPRTGNGALAAKLCPERAYWPHLPEEGATQWWGRPRNLMRDVGKLL